MRGLALFLFLGWTMTSSGQGISVQDSLLRYHPALLKPELELALKHDPGIESFTLL